MCIADHCPTPSLLRSASSARWKPNRGDACSYHKPQLRLLCPISSQIVELLSHRYRFSGIEVQGQSLPSRAFRHCRRWAAERRLRTGLTEDFKIDVSGVKLLCLTGGALWAFGKQLAYDLVYPRFERPPYKPSGNVPAADFSRVASLFCGTSPATSWRGVYSQWERRRARNAAASEDSLLERVAAASSGVTFRQTTADTEGGSFGFSVSVFEWACTWHGPLERSRLQIRHRPSELRYPTMPSELFGESPRPRSPITESASRNSGTAFGRNYPPAISRCHSK